MIRLITFFVVMILISTCAPTGPQNELVQVEIQNQLGESYCQGTLINNTVKMDNDCLDDSTPIQVVTEKQTIVVEKTAIIQKEDHIELNLHKKFHQSLGFWKEGIDSLLDLGFVYMMQNNYERAELKFNQAVQLNEKSIKARIYLATLFAAKDSRNQMDSVIWELKRNLDDEYKEQKVDSILNNLYETDQMGPSELLEIQRMVFINHF